MGSKAHRENGGSISRNTGRNNGKPGLERRDERADLLGIEAAPLAALQI
jgi:hypothetical protein